MFGYLCSKVWIRANHRCRVEVSLKPLAILKSLAGLHFVLIWIYYVIHSNNKDAINFGISGFVRKLIVFAEAFEAENQENLSCLCGLIAAWPDCCVTWLYADAVKVEGQVTWLITKIHILFLATLEFWYVFLTSSHICSPTSLCHLFCFSNFFLTCDLMVR